mmetsp:Transcript_111910/g.311511  ORF Transcript_111910/g.311511 Transcript_111910/m.311511 type:complete len:572 (+) Transcript_111910:59-1774(+)
MARGTGRAPCASPRTSAGRAQKPVSETSSRRSAPLGAARSAQACVGPAPAVEEAPQLLGTLVHEAAARGQGPLAAARGRCALVCKADAAHLRGREAAGPAATGSADDARAAAAQARGGGGERLRRWHRDLQHVGRVPGQLLWGRLARLFEGWLQRLRLLSRATPSTANRPRRRGGRRAGVRRGGRVTRILVGKLRHLPRPRSVALSHLLAERRAQGMLRGQLNLGGVAAPPGRWRCLASAAAAAAACAAAKGTYSCAREVLGNACCTLPALLTDLVPQSGGVRLARGRWRGGCRLPLALRRPIWHWAGAQRLLQVKGGGGLLSGTTSDLLLQSARQRLLGGDPDLRGRPAAPPLPVGARQAGLEAAAGGLLREGPVSGTAQAPRDHLLLQLGGISVLHVRLHGPHQTPPCRLLGLLQHDRRRPRWAQHRGGLAGLASRLARCDLFLQGCGISLARRHGRRQAAFASRGSWGIDCTASLASRQQRCPGAAARAWRGGCKATRAVGCAPRVTHGDLLAQRRGVSFLGLRPRPGLGRCALGGGRGADEWVLLRQHLLPTCAGHASRCAASDLFS